MVAADRIVFARGEVVAIIIVRSGALEIVPACRRSRALGARGDRNPARLRRRHFIWIDGSAGCASPYGVLIGLAIVAYPPYLGVKAYRLPAIYDVTTDPIDPPKFEAVARLRPRDANPVAYAGLYTAELQHAAYSDIEPDITDSSPQKLTTRR